MPRLWSPQTFVTAIALACGLAWLIDDLMPSKSTGVEPAGVAQEIERLAARSCACNDADCARATLRDFRGLAATSANQDMKISNDVRERLVAAGHKLGACARGAGVSEAELRDAMSTAK
jgi:hypothetical protein